MAKKKNTPHLDAWLRTFKRVGASSAKIAGSTLGSLAPGIRETVDSSADVIRESRQFILKHKTKVTQQARALSSTISGRSAKSILDDAYNDIKSGNFSLNKLSESSYDTLDDFEDSFDVTDIDTSDPSAVAMAESKKNTALLGKAVTEGNIATIEGMQNMTEVISNVTMKTSAASTAQITNAMVMGMGQTHMYLSGINNRLDTINANLSTLIEFNNRNVYQTNQAAVEFYSEASQMMNTMGQTIAEMQDFVTQQKEIQKKRDYYGNRNEFDFSNGFNLNEYVKMVKKNFKSSSLGMGASMGGSMLSMMGSFGMNPMEMIMSEFVLPSFVPGRMKRSIARADKTFTAGINELLYRLGDKRYSGNDFERFIGRYFGKERATNIGSANMGDFKKDAMGWNGIAQRTLVEVIPSYLAKIESSLTKQEERYYNMDTGLFQTRSQTEAAFSQNFENSVASNMREFTDKLSKMLTKANVSSADSDAIKSYISDMTYNQTSGKGGNRHSEIQQMIDMLKPYLGDNDLRDITMQYNSDLQKTLESLKSVVSDMESTANSANRHLFNTKGTSSADYYKKTNLFSGREMTLDGRFMDQMTDEELRRYQAEAEDSKRWKNRVRNIKNKFRRAFGKEELTAEDELRIKNGTFRPIDRFANYGWDKMSGYDYSGAGRSARSTTSGSPNFIILDPSEPVSRRTQSNVGKATSRATLQIGTSDTSKKIAKASRKISSSSFKNAMKLSPSQVRRDSAELDSLIQTNDILEPSATGSASLPAIVEQQSNSLQTLVLSLHNNFLKPVTSGLFGKDGFFNKMMSETTLGKLKKKLFDEKDGVFGSFTTKMKDAFDYVKYTFTGKAYTDRSGKLYPDEKNSVLGHLSNGYNFVFSNTMKYLFGEDYENNDTYNKYFSWLSFKKKKKESSKVEAKMDDDLMEYEVQSPLMLEDKRRSDMESKSNIEKAKSPFLLEDKSSKASFEIITQSEANQISSVVSNNLVLASETAATSIVDAGTALSTELIGDYSDEKKNELVKKQTSESIFSSIKKHLPKTLAAGTVGAIAGTSLGISGTGLIGSLFLPGGPISGAIVGMGIEMLSRSKGFNKFMFGETDENGVKKGGLISNKMQTFVKNNLPLIVGTTTLGAIKGLFKTSTVGGPGGFLLNTLLPGGPIGGAVLGLGIGLLRNNEKFNKILFGEKNEDGKRIGGFFNKDKGRLGKIFEKSGHFIKGGLKGLGVGALSGAVISKMGILGSAVSLGGPVGMGLAGLGIGIASQTKKFQELLFGTEEFDENGNFKGRMKNGLFSKVRNMLVVNVFEPIREKLQEKTEDFAIWAKKQIVFPFRLAFGPILDSMKGVKKNISDTIHETFNNIAESVTGAVKSSLKSAFKPFTKILGAAGTTFSSMLTKGLQAALFPVTGSLKLLQYATLPKRIKAKMKENGNIISNLGEIYYDTKRKWDEEDSTEKYGSGLLGRVRKFRGHLGDLRQGVEAGKYAYEHELSEQGYNSLNWMNVAREKKDLNRDVRKIKDDRKKWSKVKAFRNQLISDNEYGEARYSDEQLEVIKKKLSKLGIKSGVSNNKELNDFLYNTIDWKDQYDAKKDGDAAAYIAKNGVTINESVDVKKARKSTESYQQYVMNKFDEITKYFTVLAARDSLEKKRNINIKDLKALDKDLKSKGLTWDDVGVDPADLVNMGSIDDDSWDEFLKDKFESGDLNKSKNAYTNLFRRVFNESKDSATINTENVEKAERVDGEIVSEEEYQSKFKRNSSNKKSDTEATIIDVGFKELADTQEAMLEALRGIEDSTIAQEMFEGAQAVSESGVSASAINRSIGKKYTSRQLSFMLSHAKVEAAQKRAEREAAESASAKGLAGTNNEEAANQEAIIDDVTEAEEVKTEAKKGLLGSISGFFGTLMDTFMSSGFWTKVGIGTAIYGLFGDKINKFCGTLWDIIAPTVKQAFGSVMSWWEANGTRVISSVTETICNNMGMLISNAAKILWTAITTVGKMAVNALSNKLLGHSIFKDLDTEDKTFDSVEEAEATGELLDKNVYVDENGNAMILGDNSDIDSEGNVTRVKSGTLGTTLLREGAQFARSSANRSAVKATVKGGTKVLGWASGLTPATKLVRTAFRGVKAVGSGVVDVAKAGKTYYTAKKAAKSASEAGIDNVTRSAVKEMADESAEIVTKTGKKAKIRTSNKAVIKATKSTNIAKSTAATIVEENAEKATKSVARNIAEEGAKASTKSGVKGFLSKATKKLKDGAKFISKFISSTKFGKFVDEFIQDLGKKILSSDNALLKKVSEKIALKSAEATGRVAADATVILGIGFAVYDAVNGLLDAAYLFGINDDDVTAGMRIVSSIMSTLLGTAVGVWIDILLEIYAMITGNNAKQAFARRLYKFVPGSDADGLDEAITELELETDKYNKMNNTNLSVDAYNEKKNSDTTIWGRVKKGGSWLLSKASFWTSSDDKKWDEKYDYSKYEVSDAEVKAATNMKNSTSSTAYTDAQVDAYNGEDLLEGYGPGRKVRTRAIGYGYSQNDSRWANYSLGKFPDGSNSTMATGGCGPTALATVAKNLGANANPMSVAQYAKASGYIKDGGATAGLFTNGASALGLSANSESKSSIKDSLAAGKQVVVSGKSTSSNSPYTSAGHIIVASGLDSNGNTTISDPMSGNKSVKLNAITDGMTNGWSYTKSVGYGTAAPTTPTPTQAPTTPAPTSKASTTNSKITTPSPTQAPTSPKPSSSSAKGKDGLYHNDYVTHGIYLPAPGPGPDANKEGYKQEFTYRAFWATGDQTDIKTTNAKITKEDASKTKSGPLTELDFLMLNFCTLSTKDALNNKINKGRSKTSDNAYYNFNTAEFYDGLTVGDIKAMSLFDKKLLTDTTLILFSEVYNYFVGTSYYKLSDKITTSMVQGIKDRLGFDALLGGSGKTDAYEYKNGFPFFRLDDKRWSDIKWRDSKVKKRGSDLASLAMVASGFGNSIIPPNYIYKKWLQDHPEWWTSNEGLESDVIYSNGGYNIMKSTQVDGKRVQPEKVSEVKNYSTILSALKNKKPVVLTGYKYDGSIFGGTGDIKNVDPSNPDSYGSVVGLYANDAYMAVNDPNTQLSDNSVFNANLLQDKLSNNASVVKSAYVISGPNGEGATFPVDLSVKNVPESDYEEIDTSKGFMPALSSLVKNFASIGSHLLDSLLNPGKGYKSIFDTTLEGDESDTTVAGINGVDSTDPYAVGTNNNEKVYNTKLTSADRNKTPEEANVGAKNYYESKNRREYNKRLASVAQTGSWNVYDKNGFVIAACGSLSEAKSYFGGGTYLRGMSTPPNEIYAVNADNGKTYDPNGILGKKTTTTEEFMTDKPVAGISLSLGGGSRDFAIGYGPETTGTAFDSITDELAAINYANQASLLGQSYSKAKKEYYANKAAEQANVNTTTSTAGMPTGSSFTTTESENGSVKAVPSGFGKTMSYMDWDLITSKTSTQMKLINDAGKSFDKDGLGMVGDRYTVAVKPYYGTIGDYLNVQYEDGTVVKAIVADQKGRENEPGNYLYSAASNAKQRSQGITDRVHTDGSVVEWVIDGHGRHGSYGAFSGYGGSKTVAALHPEWHKNMTSITNVGNYWKNDSNNKAAGYGFGKSRAIGYGGNWLGTVIAVKQAIAAQKPGYSQSRSISVTINGVTKSVRTDCSGFVSACLQFYGVNIPTQTSTTFTSSNLTQLSSAGFTKMPFTNWESLRAGDIISRNGHVEIFARIENGRHYVYNCGSSSSVNNPDATISGHSSYTTVWRPSDAGNAAFSGMIGNSVSNTTTQATTPTSTSKFLSPLDNMISSMVTTVKSASGAGNLGFGPDSPSTWFTNTLGGTITSGYGNRNSSLGNEYHRGIDIAAPHGQNIISPINGKVVAKGNDVAGYGNYAVVRDSSGNNHVFAHMNKSVGYGIGDTITRNSVIGEVGSTGRATGDHLHYEIRKNGNKYSSIDPSTFRYGANSNGLDKSLNIQSYNNSIGSGNKDIHTEDNVNKLNIALDTDNVETKLDSLIEVMKSWAERDKETQRTNNISQVNNTTNVAYGPGKQKVVKSSSKSSEGKLDNRSLMEIHKSIAMK